MVKCGEMKVEIKLKSSDGVFEKCPITNMRPYWSVQRSSVVYTDPITGHPVERQLVHEGCGVRWWNETYLPAARRYAELVFPHTQKQTVEFQVGDVVTLNEKGLGWLVECNHVLRNSTSTITRLLNEMGDPDYFNVNIDRPFINSNLIIAKKYLRLVERPKKLTVKDIPDSFNVQGPFVCGTYYNIKIEVLGKEIEFGGCTEHEAVKEALDFCDKIADGVGASKRCEGK